VNGSVCEKCPVGIFKSFSGNQQCPDCIWGSTTLDVGSTDVSQCVCDVGWQPEIWDVQITPYCKWCNSGKYKITVGNASCDVCPEDTVSEYGATTCKCGPGTYEDDGACQSCPENAVCRNLDFDGQRFCYAGKTDCVCTYCHTGPDRGPCTECPAGSYKETLGSTACVSCPDVKHITDCYRNEKSDCVCMPGYIDDGYLSYACRPCLPGTYTNRNSNNRMRPEGSYDPGTDPHECLHCPAGKYASGIASTACIACPTGTYSSRERAVDVEQCISWVTGTFSNKTGASSVAACEPCPAGHYSAVIGSATNALCVPCRAGTYSNQTGACNTSVCTACAAGKYSTSSGASATETCTLCDAGVYSAPGASVCKLCAAGLTGPEGGPWAPCARGTWRSVDSAACVQCSANETTVFEDIRRKTRVCAKRVSGWRQTRAAYSVQQASSRAQRQTPSVSIVQITAQTLWVR
jgi:hypothetical protein